jgi:hypothetical protein
MTAPFRSAVLAGATTLFLCTTAFAADLDRKIVDGTLTYRIVMDGRGGEPPKFPMLHDAAELNRSFEVTTHLHGVVSTADPGAPAAGSTMDKLQKQLEACGDDQACGMAIAMKMMKSPKAMADMQSEGDRLLAGVGRDTVWGEDGHFCHRKGKVHSFEEMTSQDIGEGYSETVHGKGVRSGSVDDDCPDRREVARIELDGTKNLYTLVLPAFSIPTELDDKTRGVTRANVGGPAITIKGQRYAAGQVLRGKKTYDALVYVDDTPVYNRTVHIPMHAVLTWAFTPD